MRTPGLAALAFLGEYANQPNEQGNTATPNLGWDGHGFESLAPPPGPIVQPNLFTLLLGFVAVFLFLGRFHRQLGRFNTLAQLIQMRMVTFPVVTSFTGLDPSALFQQFVASLQGVPGLYRLAPSRPRPPRINQPLQFTTVFPLSVLKVPCLHTSLPSPRSALCFRSGGAASPLTSLM